MAPTDKLALIKAAKAALKKKKLHIHEMKLDANATVPCLSTGNVFADYTIGGNQCPGLPRAAFTELFGPESSGKTTWATQIAADAVRNQQTVLMLDYEHAFQARYAKRLGLDIDSPYFTIYQPLTYEDGYWYLKAFIEAKADLIIIDSVAAMVPKRILDATDMEKDAKLGEHARLTALLLKRTLGWLKRYKAPSAILLLNQIRSVIDTSGGNGPKEKTTGGRAFAFHMSVRLKIQPKSWKKLKWIDPTTGITKYIPSTLEVKLTNVKNKVSDRQGFSDLLTMVFGHGFDSTATAIGVAIRRGRIEKSGSWFEMNDSKGEQIFRCQGMGNVRKYFAEHPDAQKELITSVKALLVQADEEFMATKVGMDEHVVPDDEFDGDDAEFDEGDPFGDDEYDQKADEDDEEAA